MPTIKRNGRFVFIQPTELNKMLDAGIARKLGSMPAYEEIAKAQIPDEAPAPQQYQTKVMEAAPRAAPRRRRTLKDTNA